MSTIDTYRKRLAQAAERAGPEKATAAKILAGELRAEHKQSIRERDKFAAVLHNQHNWTFTKLCTEIHGRPNKVSAVRSAVELATAAGKLPKMSKPRAEETFAAAQQTVSDLWALYKQAKALEEEARDGETDPDVALDLPADPRERASSAAAQLRDVDARYREAVDARNRGAAALTVHAGWQNRPAAQLAGMAVRDIYPLQDKATVTAAEADPDKVAQLAAEVRQLSVRKKALTAARDEAIRTLANAGERPSDLARLVGRTDERMVQIRDER